MIDISAATSATTKKTSTMQNGKLPNLVMNDLMKFVIENDDLIREVEFPPKIDRMIGRLRVISQDFPRQRDYAATFANGTPSLEWLVAYRRRQFTSLWLEYACLPTDAEKDEFCNSLVQWWSAWCANEDRAERHLAEHRRRAS
jgi:hypothetical protein